jgi:hypothetical protein
MASAVTCRRASSMVPRRCSTSATTRQEASTKPPTGKFAGIILDKILAGCASACAAAAGRAEALVADEDTGRSGPRLTAAIDGITDAPRRLAIYENGRRAGSELSRMSRLWAGGATMGNIAVADPHKRAIVDIYIRAAAGRRGWWEVARMGGAYVCSPVGFRHHYPLSCWRLSAPKGTDGSVMRAVCHSVQFRQLHSQAEMLNWTCEKIAQTGKQDEYKKCNDE